MEIQVHFIDNPSVPKLTMAIMALRVSRDFEGGAGSHDTLLLKSIKKKKKKGLNTSV